MSNTAVLDPGSAAAKVPAGRAEAVANRFISVAFVTVREVLRFAQFLVFLLYLVVGVLGFWLWGLAFVIGSFRLLLKLTRQLLLLISALHPPPTGWTGGGVAERTRAELQRLWNQRLLLYADIALPVGRQLVALNHSARRFWHLPLLHKLSAVVIAGSFVVLPMAYVIPRPHTVQIVDRNSLSHTDGELRYLIHAIDLYDPLKTREYENEYAAYLGKFNPQGLKASLVEGHFYRLWVVGVRWNYLPVTVYPNIISAEEIDKNGNEIDRHVAPE